MIVTPEVCRLASKSNKIKISPFDENFDVPIEFDVKTQSNFNNGQSVSVAEQMNAVVAKSNLTLLKR